MSYEAVQNIKLGLCVWVYAWDIYKTVLEGLTKGSIRLYQVYIPIHTFDKEGHLYTLSHKPGLVLTLCSHFSHLIHAHHILLACFA